MLLFISFCWLEICRLMYNHNIDTPCQKFFKNYQKTTQKIEERILELIASNPQSSRSELAEALGDITEDGVKYQLNNLEKKGKIELIGPDKGGFWKILNNDSLQNPA